MKLTIEDLKLSIKRNFDFFKPHDKQLAFFKAGNQAIERLFLAGNRVGKTYAGVFETVMHLTGRYPDWWNGYRFNRAITAWICSESMKDIRAVLQSLLIGDNGLISDNDIVRISYSNNGIFDYITIRNTNGTNSILYSKSYEQGRQKFQGSRVDFIHMDEEPSYEIYKECLLRLSDVDGKGQGRLIITATPLKGMTELMVHFLRKLDLEGSFSDNNSEIVIDKKFYLHATWDDNPYISEESKEHLRKTLPEFELEAREKGIPCIGTGLIYPFRDSDFIIDDFEIPKHFARFAGMDVGYNNPTAVVWCSYDRDKDIVYIYQDYSVSQETPYIHSDRLLKMGLDWIPVLCDPSVNQKEKADGISLGEHYHRAGLNYINARYSKEEAISEILNRVRSGRLKVFKSCRKLLEERSRYSRDDKGRPVKKDDHLMNALEFAILDGFKYAITFDESSYRKKSSTRKMWV